MTKINITEQELLAPAGTAERERALKWLRAGAIEDEEKRLRVDLAELKRQLELALEDRAEKERLSREADKGVREGVMRFAPVAMADVERRLEGRRQQRQQRRLAAKTKHELQKPTIEEREKGWRQWAAVNAVDMTVNGAIGTLSSYLDANELPEDVRGRTTLRAALSKDKSWQRKK